MLNRKTRTTLVLIAIQSACLIVGFWTQHLHLSRIQFATLRERETTALLEIAVALARLQNRDSNVQRIRDVADSDALGARIRHHRIMLVDDRWNVLDSESFDGEPFENASKIADWTPNLESASDGRSDTDSEQARSIVATGVLNIGQEEFAAAAADLPGGGKIVVYSPLAEIRATAALLAQNQIGVCLVTLAWLVAVLAVGTWLIVGPIYDRIKSPQVSAQSDLLRQTQRLVRTRDAIIFGLAKLADSRDADTGAHLERIAAFSKAIAQELKRTPGYKDKMTPAFLRLIGISSALHDIGKVGVPDRILLKRGKLTQVERREMHRHTLVANECLEEIEQRLGTNNFLQMARQIALCHHERWDGWGYPNRIRGDQIPLAARIVAIADVYDALSTQRVYKPAYPHAQCVAMMREEAGGYFDPDIFEAFLRIEAVFEQISRQHHIQDARRNDTAAQQPPDQGIGDALEELIEYPITT